MTRVLPIFASGALAILTTGCAGTGARTDLKPVFPATLRNADAVAARTAVPPAPELTTWWRGYGDPELTRLVEKALTANLDVAQAETRLREADALVRRARADRLPGGAVTGSVARQRQSLEGAPGRFLADIPGFSRDQTVFDTGAQASWELDLFGRLGAAARSARAARGQADALLDGVRVRIAAEAADAYLGLVGARERVGIIERQLEVLSRLVGATERRFDAGEAGLGEREEARSDRARAASLLELARLDAEVQANRLRVLTGGEPGATVATRIPNTPALPVLATPAAMLTGRPDVRAAAAAVAAADARTAAALAEYYPSISIAGLIGFQSLDADRLFTGNALQAQGLVGIRWRLFDFARIDAEVAASRARGDASVAAYRQALLLATEDVENALFALVSREREQASLAASANALERSAYASRRLYDAGVAGLPQLLDAERRLLALRQDEAAARLGAARAGVATFRAVGGRVGERKAVSAEASTAIVGGIRR